MTIQQTFDTIGKMDKATLMKYTQHLISNATPENMAFLQENLSDITVGTGNPEEFTAEP